MKKRLARLQESLPEGIDAALITSPVNRRYYTGFPSSAGVAVVTRRQAYLIIDSRYYEAAKASVQGFKVVLQDKPLSQVKKILRTNRAKRVGIESKAMTVSQLRACEKELPGIELLTDDRLSDRMAAQRAVKEPGELAMIRAAQEIADKAFLHILNFIQSGRIEREIALELEQFCRREGSDAPAFEIIVASGPNSSVPHAVSTGREIVTGDFVTLDYGCTVGGYCSDMTRTVAVGAVSPRQAELYETVRVAQEKSLEVIRAGASCKAVDKAARDVIEASEFAGMFGHGLGHCVGLEVHETPACNTLSEETLAAGMVTSVEPGIYVPGQFGARIEDIVAVTDQGCDNLCTSPKELIIL